MLAMSNQFLAKVAKTWVKTDSRTRRALIGPQRVAIGKVTFKSKKSFRKPSTKVAMTANGPTAGELCVKNQLMRDKME